MCEVCWQYSTIAVCANIQAFCFGALVTKRIALPDLSIESDDCMKVSMSWYSARLWTGLLLILSGGTYVVVQYRDYSAHQSCWGHRMGIGSALQDYYRIHGAPPPGTIINWEDKIPFVVSCPRHGKYSVSENSNGTISVRCSYPQHDNVVSRAQRPATTIPKLIH